MSHSGPREHAPRTMHTSGQQRFQSPQLGGPSGRLHSKAILRRLSGTSTEEGGKTQTTFCLQPYKGALAEWERERCPAGVCVLPTAGPWGVSDSMPGMNSRALSIFSRGNVA